MIDIRGGETFYNGELTSFDMTDPRDVEQRLKGVPLTDQGLHEDLSALLARRLLKSLGDGEPISGTGDLPAYPYEPPVNFHYFTRRTSA